MAGLLLTVLPPAVARAQTNPRPTAASIDPQLKKLESLAMACPPGMAADALLKLIDLAPREKASWKVQTIQEAFDIARGAEPAYPTRPVPVGFTDTVPAMSAISSRLVQVDSLSLRLRAVQAMLIYDPARARDMFESIPPPGLAPLTCKDLVVPDIRPYYEALRAVAERGFTPAEVQKGDRDAFLSQSVPVTSPLQVFPVVGLLSELNIPPASRERLLSAFAAAVTDIRGDDRSFAMAFLEDRPVEHLLTLVRQCQASGISPVAIVDALRKLYARHLAARHCADTAQSKPLQDRQAEAVAGFNEIALAHLPSQARLDVPPLDGPFDDPTVAADLWDKSPDYRDFSKRIGKLQDAVQAAAEEAIRTLDAWEAPDGLAPREFFIIKSIVLNKALRGAAKDDHNYRVASDAYVHFLDSSVDERDGDPAVWLHSLSNILQLAHSQGPLRTKILLSALGESKNPVLNLYAFLDRRATALAHGS
jgi:hypothetical protein